MDPRGKECAVLIKKKLVGDRTLTVNALAGVRRGVRIVLP